MYSIGVESVFQKEVEQLIAALDAYQHGLYPAESNHCTDLRDVESEQLIFMVIRDQQGIAVGCGAILVDSRNQVGEIKRIYIDKCHRGQRLGEKLLAALEDEARQQACLSLRLETGIKQYGAITLYQRQGYQQVEAFAPYKPDPLSLFMAKNLPPVRL